jgi:hypothetical protein
MVIELRPPYLTELAQDKTPELGGDLDGQDHKVQGISLVSFSNFAHVEIDAAGAIEATQTCLEVDSYGGIGADDLVTITGGSGSKAQILFIHCAAVTRPITVKHGVDNIFLQGKQNIILDDVTTGLFLLRVYTPIKVIWVDVTKMAPTVGWEYVDSVILSSDVPTISFDNLPPEYNAYRLTCFVRRFWIGTPVSVAMIFNDDTGNNYESIELRATTTPVTGLAATVATVASLYNAAAPTTWAELTVYSGADEGTALLEVRNDGSNPVTLRFRRYGSALTVDASAGGASVLQALAPGEAGYVVVRIGAGGKCQWISDVAETVRIWRASAVVPASKLLADVSRNLAQPYALIGLFDGTHYGIAFVYVQNRLASTEKDYLSFAGLGSSHFYNISGRWNNTADIISKITISAVIGNLLAGTQFILEGAREPT